MPDRLSALDASFLYLEQPSTPMHVGGVAIFRPPRAGFDYDRLVELIGQRLALVPRYRQKVRHVPGNLARPVWVDDPDFDIAYHVRRSALPRPGADAALHELVARLMSRPLDHTRPLWETYLVEGLAKNRTAVITKTHQAMVDGTSAIDIAQVILDVSPTPRSSPPDEWIPRAEPGGAELVLDAVAYLATRPGELADGARRALGDVLSATGKIVGAAGQLLSIARAAARRAPGSPLNTSISPHRRFAVSRTSLAAYRRIRSAHGCTVNDVMLAVVTGALRAWLASRGEPVTSSSTVRAMVPLSVRAAADLPGSTADAAPGHRVASSLVELPVGEPNAVVRLHQISHAMRAHSGAGDTGGADTLIRIGGFAPATLHALGARAASGFAKRIFNIVITSVPGPQFPLYAAGARMLELFPVVPLAKGQALAIGLTAYEGGLYYGFTGDRDAMPDIDVLAGMVEESLDELLGSKG